MLLLGTRGKSVSMLCLDHQATQYAFIWSAAMGERKYVFGGTCERDELR